MIKTLERIDLFLLGKFQALCNFLERRYSFGTIAISITLFHLMAVSLIAGISSEIFLEGTSWISIVSYAAVLLFALRQVNFDISQKKKGLSEKVRREYDGVRRWTILLSPFICYLGVDKDLHFVRVHPAWANAWFIAGELILLVYFLLIFFISCIELPQEEK